MTPTGLLRHLGERLWELADDAAADLGALATNFPVETSAPPPLRGRLLIAFDRLPDGNALAGIVGDVLGELPAGEPVRLHGWERAPGSARGVALVATEGDARAVLAITPGPPSKVDVVVMPGAGVSVEAGAGAWLASVGASSDTLWDAELSRGAPAAPAVGTATIGLKRTEPLTIASSEGVGVSVSRIEGELKVRPGAPLSLELSLNDFQAALLPPPLVALLDAGRNPSTTPSRLRVRADAAGGVRFDGTGLRVELPARLPLPALSAKGFAVELAEHAAGIELRTTIGLNAELPGIPVHAELDGVGVSVPFAVGGDALGPVVDGIRAPLPSSMAIELALPPVSGGGAVLKTDSGYAGVLDLDLGVFGVQAFGVVALPRDGAPTSVLALLAATFPFPGLQLGFGFALDAVGGLVGVNRRVDTEQLRALVIDGHADRVLFPDNAVERAGEITRSLEAAFPVSPGRCVIAPMVRLNWGGRMVTLSGAVVLDLPGPARIVVLGRLLVEVPPGVPLIRLQASVLGRIDPAVPETELLVSLAGSWIVGIPVSGEVYLLVRGGDQAVFVLSAGGFHPRYARPPGVPALRRLAMDLGGGDFGLRAEAYLAVTSNAMMFGAKLQLDATIAGCGIEGQLGLDALFVWEPTFSFSVRVYASVAVLVLGKRLAGVGLDFTLMGPAPWRAFGTGTVSLFFKDISLDFDVGWGDEAPAALPRDHNIRELLEGALARSAAWVAERPLEQRNAVRLTDRAKADLADGRVVQADATFRVSQTVVPLGVPITRFARDRIPEQRWDMAGGGAVSERFVPGEFRDLSTEEQLTLPAFVEEKSGVSMSHEEVLVGRAAPVDDGYETGYEVEPGFQREDPGIVISLVFGHFVRERFARVVPPNERVALWRTEQEAFLSDTVVMR